VGAPLEEQMPRLALGTLGGVLLTSAARKQMVRQSQPEKGSMQDQLRTLRKDPG